MQRSSSWIQRYTAATLVAFCSIALITLTAWGQEGPAKAPARDGLKPLAFEFRDTPWDKVLDWLADNSGGMPIVSNIKPPGTFNFVSPGGKKYTLPQIIDILNRSLIKDKILIIRGSTNFTVISQEDALTIDTTILPNITIDELDIGKPADQQKYGSSELVQITFTLNNLSVEEGEANLTSRKGPFGRFMKIPKANMLLVTDTVGNLRYMKQLLDVIDPSTTNVGFEVFQLRPSASGTSVETTIKTIYGGNPGQAPVPNAPKISLDESTNRLMVNGDKSQLKTIRDMLTKMNVLKAAPVQTPVEPGTKPQTPTQNQGGLGPVEDSIRTIIIKQDNASQYVDNLKYMLETLRANPVYLTLEPVMQQDLENARKGIKPKVDPKKQQLVDEKEPTVVLDNRPGDPKRPIFVASLSRSNGVMLGSDDPEAIDFAEQVLAYLVKDGDTNYEIIPLKNSNAQIVRDTLDELINGKRQQGNPMAMMMPFGGGGGGMREAVTGPVVRLAADKRTNSLLVRAPRQIAVTIRRFVETELDVNNIEQKLQPIPRIIQLVNADATTVVDILKEIYKEYVQASPAGGMQPGMPFNPFMQAQQAQQPERSIKLSVTANPIDNSLILNCPEVIWPEVEKLVKEMDKNDADNTKQVKVINVGKADPVMLQRAVDAVTGKKNQGQQDPQAAMRNALMNRFGGMGGMGFPMMGGGGGGNRMGGGGRGNAGGGGRGNAGGRGGRGGGQRSDDPPAILQPSSMNPGGGTDFFAGRVKEDPRTQVTFDSESNNNQIVQAQAQTPAGGQPAAQGNRPVQQPNQLVKPDEKGFVKAPRGDVTVEVLPDGQIILMGTKEDIEEFEKILRSVAESNPSSSTELRLFGLDHLDASSATNLLSKIFNKYNPVVKVISGGGTGSTPAGGGFGGGARPGGFGQGGFGQGGFGQGAQGGLGQQGIAAQPAAQPGNLLILTISRQNSILIGAPKTAMEEIEKTIKLIDKPIDPESAPKIIKLRKANAQSLAATLQQFYQQRYPDEPQGQNEIRIQFDVKTNSLIIHAGPADLKEIMNIVEVFEKGDTKVVNEVRIKQLKNASATELATILQQALSQALLQGGQGTGTGTTPLGQQGLNPFGQQGGQFGQQNRAGQAGGLGTTGQTQDRKGVSLSFTQPGQGRIETGLLDDVGIYADARSNRIIISAPPESIAMLEKLIDELDVVPSVMADVKVFRLKNTDAQQALTTLQGIFLGTNQQRAGQGGVGQGGFFGGGNFGNQQNQQQLNFSATAGQGPQPLIPRMSVDLRTNSLIVAAGRGDMILIEVLLNNLDSTAIRDRFVQVVRLKNNQAGNVAQNLTTFFSNEIRILQLNDLTNFTTTDREVTVIADASNNSLLVAASQRYFTEVMRMIEQLDIELAQVAIQVLIAAVDLENSDEFGVEVGLQSPILFERSLFNPQPVNNATNGTPAIGNPGYNWNNVSTAGTNNFTNAGPGVVGMQGLTNYGTGRANSTNGFGGFVFSAASNSVNVLVRALRTQGRIEVLSRPQIVTRDNQQALISVGQQVPIITGSQVTAQGIITNTVEQQQVGIILKVLPQISPDGRVVMRVEPQVSRVSNSTVDIGNGVRGTILDQTIASTTIDAYDGQTVVIGGLIQKRDEKQQRGIPWLGDLPYLGALFRYRSQDKRKSELLIIMTPHIIRNPMDAQRVFMEEGRKMSWSLDDVQAIHGTLPGGSFLQKNCPDDPLPGSMINPFDQKYFAPNTTVPGPVDETLSSPQGGKLKPQAPQQQPQQQMPVPNPPVPQQQPQVNPGYLQPYNPTAPMFQTPQAPGAMPPGQTLQQQNWQLPSSPVNNTVTGLPPQGTAISPQRLPINNNQQGSPPPGALPPEGLMTYGQAMQLQQQQQLQQQMMNSQPQQQINGNYKTVVTYGPVNGNTANANAQNQQINQGYPGGQQP